MACLILLLPLWAFGFGLASVLKRSWYPPFLLLTAYPIFALPLHVFRWDMLLGMAAIIFATGFLVERGHDWLALAILGISVDLRFFNDAWPVAGLSGLTKLMFVDTALYAYLVLRPIGGIGYDFRPRLRDFTVGLREFVLFTPIAISLGFALGFLHFHKTLPSPLAFGAGWLFTLFFIAVPEELFFRGLMQNLLERRIGMYRALWVNSVLFGLAHFNKRAAYFNWRYVILATIAGVFYTRAWLDRSRILSSSIAHATVDTVWSVWFR